MESDVANTAWTDANSDGEEADQRSTRGERLRHEADQARLRGPDPRQSKTDQQDSANDALGGSSLVVRVDRDEYAGVNRPSDDEGHSLDEQKGANRLLRCHGVLLAFVAITRPTRSTCAWR